MKAKMQIRRTSRKELEENMKMIIKFTLKLKKTGNQSFARLIVRSHPAVSLDLGDVGLLGIIAAHAFLSFPGVPFGLALKVEHAGAIGVHITDGGLLEQAVELEFLFIGKCTDGVGNVLGGHPGRSIFKGHLLILFV